MGTRLCYTDEDVWRVRHHSMRGERARDMEAKRDGQDAPARLTRLGSYKAPSYPPETPVEELPPFLTSGQASEWLGVSRRKIAAMGRSGELHPTPSALDKRYVLFARDEVASYRTSDPRYVTTLERRARQKPVG